MKQRDPLLRRLREALRVLDCEGRAVLIAVSGGIDSSVLVHGVAALRAELGIAASLGHVNHGLRGAESDADEAFVRGLGAALGLPVLVREVAPRRLREGVPSRARPTLQEAARRLRREALLAMAAEAGAERVATAHTLDDQAETVLLRLLRGVGPGGLGGIPERSPEGRLVRPLLAVSRAEIERFALGRGLVWREDASNRDPAYARARLRRDWLGALGEAFNPRWLRAVGDLAEAQRRESEWIDGNVSDAAARMVAREGTTLVLVREGWRELPEALARRLVRRVLHEAGAGRDVSRKHVERVLAALRSPRTGATLELPGGLALSHTRSGARLVRTRAGRSQHGC